MSDDGPGPSDPKHPSMMPIPLLRREPDSEPQRPDSEPQRPTALPIPLVRAAPAPVAEPALRIRELTVSFFEGSERLRVLDRVSLEVPRRGTLALVGESGSGKSMTALSVLRLLPPLAAIEGGAIELDGRDLLGLGEREMRDVRGGKIALVFQEPMTSLNPVYTVGAQVAEAIRLHARVSRAEARRQATEWLRKVGLPDPERARDSYPHELSGGMRQRVMIAMALAPGPALLIADEPTTALDMTTQAQILDLLEALRADLGMSLLLIAHDLSLVGEIADEVAVMYAGRVVEQGPARAVLAAPAHPYTRALLRSAPRAGAYRVRGERRAKLPVLGGAPPDPRAAAPGCRFEERCPEALERCRAEAPELAPFSHAHSARCFLVEGARPEGAA